MRLPPVLGPRDLWQLLERAGDAVEQMLAAVPKAAALLGEAEVLLARTRRLVDEVEATREGAQQVVARSDAVVEQAEAALATVVSLTDRVTGLLDVTEPSVRRLEPVLERLSRTTSAREVDALVHLIDHLPVLAQKLEAEVMPVLDGLDTVAPDLHDLLDMSRELNEMLGQIPGLGRIKRRVDEQQASDDG